MRILKCLSWFKMNPHIKDCVSFEFCAFVDVGDQECCFLIGNFRRKFDRMMMIILFACSMNCSILSLFIVQSDNMSSIKRFETSGFSSLWLRISLSTLFMNIIRKGDSHFRAYGRCTMCLKVVFP